MKSGDGGQVFAYYTPKGKMENLRNEPNIEIRIGEHWSVSGANQAIFI